MLSTYLCLWITVCCAPVLYEVIHNTCGVVHMVMHHLMRISTALSTLCVDNLVLTAMPSGALAMAATAAVVARVGSGTASMCGSAACVCDAGYDGV